MPEIDGAVVGVDTWNEAVFCLAPKLKAMARFGVGVDNIDLEAAKAHGPLFGMENYIATPHVSAETYENCKATSVMTAKALLAVFEGREPEHRLV